MTTTHDDLQVKTLTVRGRRTRARLITAARVVFERDGFAAARITDIADEAGVAHGTFYTYFDSKEQIFREVILTVREVMLFGAGERTPAGRPRTPRESIAQANRRYLDAYRNNCSLMIIWEQAATINTEFRDMLTDSRHTFTGRSERFIRRLQDEGVADPDIDAHYAAHALGAMMSKFAYSWFAAGENFEYDRAVDQLTRLWCNAIGLKPGSPGA
jgi:AcrR family transcriptional regulator